MALALRCRSRAYVADRRGRGTSAPQRPGGHGSFRDLSAADLLAARLGVQAWNLAEEGASSRQVLHEQLPLAAALPSPGAPLSIPLTTASELTNTLTLRVQLTCEGLACSFAGFGSPYGQTKVSTLTGTASASRDAREAGGSSERSASSRQAA